MKNKMKIVIPSIIIIIQIIAIIIICQGISFTTNIVFIRLNMRFITYKDILVVYIEKILIMSLIIFLIYYFF